MRFIKQTVLVGIWCAMWFLIAWQQYTIHKQRLFVDNMAVSISQILAEHQGDISDNSNMIMILMEQVNRHNFNPVSHER